MKHQKIILSILFITACIGLLDSFFLVTEYFHALTSGGAPTPCSPSSLVSCTKTVQGEWAHLLGVSNPLFGMLWYGLFTFYGLARLCGTFFDRYTRILTLVVAILGIIFSYTLYAGSILVLRGVCPFCLLSTLASTVILYTYILDDRKQKDIVITNAFLPYVYSAQAISMLVYAIGLPVFLAINIPLLLNPIEALTHWSFPVMILLILGMWAINIYTWRQLHTLMIAVEPKTWWQKLLRR